MVSRRREDAYEDGYDDGYEEGYDEGYEDGEPDYDSDDEYRGGAGRVARRPVLPWVSLVTLTCLLSAMGGRP